MVKFCVKIWIVFCLIRYQWVGPLCNILAILSYSSKCILEWWSTISISMYLLQIWHLTWINLICYVCAHVEFGVVEYFFLKELFFGLVVHVFFKEVKGCVSLLGFDGSSHSLLFLEDSIEVLIISVVATALYVAHMCFIDWLCV